MQNPNYPQYPQYPQYQPPVRTVWTDLDAERTEMTAGERLFVEQDKEYQQADYALQAAFQTFLQGMFRDDFLKTDTKDLAGRKLLALRVARKGFEKQNDGIMDDPEIKALIEKKRSERSGNGN